MIFLVYLKNVNNFATLPSRDRKHSPCLRVSHAKGRKAEKQLSYNMIPHITQERSIKEEHLTQTHGGG